MKNRLWLTAAISALIWTTAGAQNAATKFSIAPDQQKRLDVLKSKGMDGSLTILPVRLGGKPFDRVSEVVGLLLEKKKGLKKIELGKTAFESTNANTMENLSADVGAFVRANPVATDYALYAEFNGTRQTGLNEIRAVVVDKTGAVVWTERQTQQDEAFRQLESREPMTLSMLLVERLSPQFGLND